MDEDEVNRIIDSEREWRRYLLKEVTQTRTEVTEMRVDIGKMKVWIWIGRGFFVTAWGAIYVWIRIQLGH